MVRLEGRFEGEGIVLGSIARGYCTGGSIARGYYTGGKSLGSIVQRGYL